MAKRAKPVGHRYTAYARRMDGPMLVLALLFLAIWSETSIDRDLSASLGDFLFDVNAFIWVLFAIDLTIRVVLAKSSWRFLVHHPLDVLAVTVPMLRPLKVLTVFSSGGGILTRRGALRTGQAVLASAAVVVWVAAVTVHNFEIGFPGASITSFGGALWWAMTTITTVGYGDLVPVTTGGRIVGAGLMVVGTAIFGLVTAWVAAWFVRLTAAQDSAEEDATLAKNAAEIRRLSRQVENLEEKIDQLLDAPEGEAR